MILLLLLFLLFLLFLLNIFSNYKNFFKSVNKINKINLIIATYSGTYEKYFHNNDKKNYLKFNLLLLNKIKTDIDQITIMKPKINENHIEMLEYYNFNDLDIENIRHKIKIYECENIGISYGQLFTAISKTIDFDYHIFIEDDYICFKDYFENDLINELKKKDIGSFLCLYIHENKYWNIIGETQIYEKENMLDIVKNKLIKYNNLDKSCIVPDFSLGILSKVTVNKILDSFHNFNNIIDFFNIKFEKIWLHQILFGYIFEISNVKIYETSSTYLNLFFETNNSTIQIYNKKKEIDIPLFIPLELILYYNNYDNTIKNTHEYLNDENYNNFVKKINYLEQYLSTYKNKNI
jgi:hypothetical protein